MLTAGKRHRDGVRIQIQVWLWEQEVTAALETGSPPAPRPSLSLSLALGKGHGSLPPPAPEPHPPRRLLGSTLRRAALTSAFTCTAKGTEIRGRAAGLHNSGASFHCIPCERYFLGLCNAGSARNRQGLAQVTQSLGELALEPGVRQPCCCTSENGEGKPCPMDTWEASCPLQPLLRAAIFNWRAAVHWCAARIFKMSTT